LSILLEQNRKTLVFLSILFLCSGLLVYVYYSKNFEKNISTVEEPFEALLQTHRAFHTYVKEIQKTVIYQLKAENKLYTELFSPKLLSFTYIVRNVKTILLNERLEQNILPITFKLASSNSG